MTVRSLHLSLLSIAALSMLTACADPKPDHRIKLVNTYDGRGVQAVPPECLSWAEHQPSTSENHPWPQYGCAMARNLAMQVERPEDLIEPKDLGSANATVTAAAQSRYQAGKTTPLIDPNKQEPLEIKKMEDKRTGGGQEK